MVALLEDWMDLSIGANVNDSADWEPQSGGAGTALVAEGDFSFDVRSANWEGTTGQGSFLTTWTNQSQVAVSFYWQGHFNAGSGTTYIAKISPNTSGAPGAEFRISGGKFQLRDATSAVATSSMNANMDDSEYRFEWRVNQGTTTQTLNIYAGANKHGTTPDETISGAYTQGNVGRLLLGSVANPSANDTSMKYAWIGVQNSAFLAPFDVGGQLDTPTNFVFNRTAGAQQIVASATAVDGAVSYELEVEFLSGADPEVEGDWSPLDIFVSATPSWTLDSGDGIEWAETYRGRIIAKVT